MTRNIHLQTAQPSEYKLIFERFFENLQFQQTNDGRFVCTPSDLKVVKMAIQSVNAKLSTTDRLQQCANAAVSFFQYPDDIDVNHGVIAEQTESVMSLQSAIDHHGQTELEREDALNLSDLSELENVEDLNEGHLQRSVSEEIPRTVSRVEGQLAYDEEEKWTVDPAANPSKSTKNGLQHLQALNDENSLNEFHHFNTMKLCDLDQLGPLQLMRTRSLSLNDMQMEHIEEPDGLSEDDTESSLDMDSPLNTDPDRDDVKLPSLPPVVGSCASADMVRVDLSEEDENEVIVHQRSRTFDRSHSVQGVQTRHRGRTQFRFDRRDSPRRPPRRSQRTSPRRSQKGSLRNSSKRRPVMMSTLQSVPSPRALEPGSPRKEINNLRILLPSEKSSLERHQKRDQRKMKGSKTPTKVFKSLFHGLRRKSNSATTPKTR